MDINELIAIVKKKIEKEIVVENISDNKTIAGFYGIDNIKIWKSNHKIIQIASLLRSKNMIV